MTDRRSIQETHLPDGICFGCGPQNDRGLHLHSHVDGDRVVARWTPEPHHQAFPGILNGGIIGTLLDCHSNAAAWWAVTEGRFHEGPTVTGAYAIELARPTPIDRELTLVATVAEATGRKAVIEAHIEVDGEVTARCRGTFVLPRSRPPPPPIIPAHGG